MTERKATEVILNIEKMVNTLLSYFSNQKLLIETALNRLKVLEEKVDLLTKTENISVPSSPPPPLKNALVKQIPGIKPGVKLKSKEKVSIPDFPEYKEPEKKEKNYPVQQLIVYSENKNPLAMANVEIIDKNGETIRRIKTNATGKWSGALPIGEYIVAISKKDINVKRNITIHDSKEPIKLEVIEL